MNAVEYKVSIKVEGLFHKTSTQIRRGGVPVGTEKIKEKEPFFLVEGENDDEILKKLLADAAAVFLHQKYGRSAEMATAMAAAKQKFNLV